MLFVLHDAYSNDKNAIFACLDELFKVATIQREEIIIVMVRGVNLRISI